MYSPSFTSAVALFARKRWFFLTLGLHSCWQHCAALHAPWSIKLNLSLLHLTARLSPCKKSSDAGVLLEIEMYLVSLFLPQCSPMTYRCNAEAWFMSWTIMCNFFVVYYAQYDYIISCKGFCVRQYCNCFNATWICKLVERCWSLCPSIIELIHLKWSQ